MPFSIITVLTHSSTVMSIGACTILVIIDFMRIYLFGTIPKKCESCEHYNL